MQHSAPSIYLITPVLDDVAAFGAALDEACTAATVTAVLLRLAPADERTLVKRIKAIAPVAQIHGAAVVVADPGGDLDLATLVSRGGADGGHAVDPKRLGDLCERLTDGRNIGAGGLRTKHDAMVAGELGVDYVLFGEPRLDGSLPSVAVVVDRTSWWAEIFQTPCVVYAPSLALLPELAATGAEFIALGDAVWTHPDGPSAAMKKAAEVLALNPGGTTSVPDEGTRVPEDAA